MFRKSYELELIDFYDGNESFRLKVNCPAEEEINFSTDFHEEFFFIFQEIVAIQHSVYKSEKKVREYSFQEKLPGKYSKINFLSNYLKKWKIKCLTSGWRKLFQSTFQILTCNFKLCDLMCLSICMNQFLELLWQRNNLCFEQCVINHYKIEWNSGKFKGIVFRNLRAVVLANFVA